MESARARPLYFSIGILLLVHHALSNISGECKSRVVSCMKCDGNNTSHCSRCSQLVLRNRQCQDESSVCPPGYDVKRWSSLIDFMATACQDRLSSKGVPGELVGGSIGVIVCIAAALAAGLYCKYGKKRRKHTSSLSHSTQGSETSERDMMEYLREIRDLRPEAPLFLEMLNETRRQVRNLPSYSALQPYRPVLKDLSRILILLNRPENRLNTPPPDWETLFNWAHRILARYKKHHANEVNELVNFFQGEPSRYSSGSSALDSNYNSRKRESIERDEYIEWQQAAQLEDFVNLGLGFRPQDEITTEL
uniref:Isoleucine--tRNA ligase n=1 Tax=Lygus hesperus TaxID=30085 RepID=A0A0A9Y1P3_LYGHE